MIPIEILQAIFPYHPNTALCIGVQAGTKSMWTGVMRYIF